MTNSKPTQELKVLEALKAARGEWVNGQYFLRELFLSQYHRAIWNLQHRRERYGYEGTIEASDSVDDYNFKSYRLVMHSIPKQVNPVQLEQPATYERTGTCVCGCGRESNYRLSATHFKAEDLLKINSKYLGQMVAGWECLEKLR